MSIAYPLHESWRPYVAGKDDKSRAKEIDDAWHMRECAGSMILTEQAGMEHKELTLFCLSCKSLVGVEAQVYARANEAASSDGWAPSVKGDLTPGTLPKEARDSLWASGFVDAGRRNPAGWSSGDMRKLRDIGWHIVRSLGFADENGLTPGGIDMQRRLCDPEVPASVATAVNDPGYLKAYAKRAKEPKPKKSKPVAPSLPMVCACTHGVASHTSSAASYLGSECRVWGCGCKRYVQQKPEKPTKAPRAKRIKAA